MLLYILKLSRRFTFDFQKRVTDSSTIDGKLTIRSQTFLIN